MTESTLLPCPLCGASGASTEDCGGHYETSCGTCQVYTWGEAPSESESTWNHRPVALLMSRVRIDQATIDELDAFARREGTTKRWYPIPVVEPGQ